MVEASAGEHYRKGGIETIDFIQAKSSPEEFRGYLRLTVLKYISRLGFKRGEDPLQDAKKAKWFLDRLIKEYENEQCKKVENVVDDPAVGSWFAYDPTLRVPPAPTDSSWKDFLTRTR